MKKIIIAISIFAFCINQKGLAQKNIFQLGIGIGGSDGVDEQSIYEINYKRKISKLLTVTFQYAHISGEERGIGSYDETFNGTRYLGSKNKSTNAVQDIALSNSYYFGLEVGIVRTTNSTLYLLGGTRLNSLYSSRTVRGGSQADDLKINLANSTSLGPEIGIGYERRFTRNYSLGGKFVIGPSTSFFGASLTAGVYF